MMKSNCMRTLVIIASTLAASFIIRGQSSYAVVLPTPTPNCDQSGPSGNKDCERDPDRVEWGVYCNCKGLELPPSPGPPYAAGYACDGSGGRIGYKDGITHNFEFYRGSAQAGNGCPKVEECVFHREVSILLEDKYDEDVMNPLPADMCDVTSKYIKCAPTLYWARKNCDELGGYDTCSTTAESDKSIRGDIYILAQSFDYSHLKEEWDEFTPFPLTCTVTTEIKHRIVVQDKNGTWRYKQGFCSSGGETLTFDIKAHNTDDGVCFEVDNTSYSISIPTKCDLSADNRAPCDETQTCACGNPTCP